MMFRYVLTLLTIFFISSQNVTAQTIWYSYQDGDWSDPLSWTTDGSAFPLFVNASSLLPGPADEVVISNGKKITIQSADNNQRTIDGGDDDQAIDLANLEVTGELFLLDSDGHDFTHIEGIGSIYMEGEGSDLENFPTYTTNTFFDEDDGGTLVIQGDGMTLDEAETYGSLEIDLDATTDIVTLMNDVTVDGDLIITQGVFQINDATNSEQQNLTVNDDVVVTSNGSMTVGTGDPGGTTTGYGNYHKYFHVFTINGSFTNNGIITFDNISVPVYDTRTSTGGVSLVFSGASNETFDCNSTTDLYYLVVSKGTDQTYSLTITSTDIANFALFGDNDEDWDATDSQNPEMRKALWIEAGQLILNGQLFIPSLSEGGVEFTVGENAALVLSGSSVDIWTTASESNADISVWPDSDFTGLSHGTPTGISELSTDEGLFVFGTLEINDGIFSTNDTEGLIYRAEADNATVEFGGGTILLDQFRISSAASAATAKVSYIQTGGDVYLKKDQSSDAMFDMSAQLGSFVMTGGNIYIEDNSDTDPTAIEIDCDVSNINVSGGTITINNDGANSISTTAPLYNLVVSGDADVSVNNDLEILNSLTINEDDFDMNGFNLEIGKDLTIETGVTLTALNDLTFDGASSSRIFNNTGASITIPGDLIVNKTDANKSVTVNTQPMTITGQLNVIAGNFDYNDQNVTLVDIFVADTIGTTSSTGSLILGTGAVTIESDGGLMHDITFNNTNGASLDGDLIIDGTFTFTDGLFDLNKDKLTIGPNGSISGTGFSATKMFVTDGSSSDDGLELYIANDGGSYSFPIGATTSRYTPIVVDMSDTNLESGYISFNCIDDELPALDGISGGEVMTYYWRMKNRDFGSTTDIISSITMTYDDSDDGDGGPLQGNDNYYGGYVFINTPFTIVLMDDELDYTGGAGDGQIIFDGNWAERDGNTAGAPGAAEDFDLDEAYFTSGTSPKFNGALDVFYSISDGDWDDAGNWSPTGHNGTGGTGSAYPQAGDIAIIGYDGTDYHRMAAVGDVDASVLIFNSLSGANAADVNLSRLTFENTEDLNASLISGTGELHFLTNGTTIGSINAGADLGDFVSNPTSNVLYNRNQGGGSGNFTITALDEYPTVRFYANAANSSTVKDDMFLLDRDIICENMLIDGNAALYVDQNITIRDTLWMGANRDGDLIFHNGASAVTVEVEDINYGTTVAGTTENRNRIIVETGGGNGVEHTLRVTGDIHMQPGSSGDNGADFDLFTTALDNNVILELSGIGTHSFERTSITAIPELYRLEMNKGVDTTNTFTINTDIELNGTTNSSPKAVQLDNGKLVLNDTDITLTLSSGGPDYEIPGTAGLEIQDATVDLDGTDLLINGLLRINGAGASLDMSGSENNLIYGSTGDAKIDIVDGTLDVGGQVRRETTSTSGVLSYEQTGGTSTFGTFAASESSRGVFEIANNIGSSFDLSGGSFTIANDNGANPTVASLFLDPQTSNIDATATITLGDGVAVPVNPITINSTIDIPNLYVEGATSVSVKLLIQDLVITDNLDTENNTTFDANGQTLTVGGDFTNDGTYTANGNHLIFNGTTAQALSGAGSETIYDMTYSGSDALTLSKDITVSNDLIVGAGMLVTGTQTIDLIGDATVDGTVTSTSGNGLRFSGSTDQILQRTNNGRSTIGILTVNNSEQVEVPDGNGYEFEITEELALTDGLFNLGGDLLIMETDATISGTFSLSNMIRTNNSYIDGGIRKMLPDGSLSNYVVPIGEVLYTPVTLDLSNTGTGTDRYVTLRPANEPHPSVADNTLTLSHYWVIKSQDVTNLTGDFITTYIDPDHIPGTATETDFLPARLLGTQSSWDKAFSTADVDEAANTTTFSLTAESSADIQGDYTAGEDAGIGTNVETASTTGDGGDFSDTGTWSGGTIPQNGVIVTVLTGDTLVMNTDDRRFLRVEIQTGGVLDMTTSTGQSIGTVTGSGTMEISGSSFPNGDYTNFFTCTGGGIVYKGSTDYSVLANIFNIREVTFSGTGERQLSSNDIDVCEDLTIDGPMIINDNDVDITIGDTFYLNSGSIETGTNSTWSIADSLDINGGTFTAETGAILNITGAASFDGGTFNAASSTINLSGDLARTTGTFTAGTSSLVFTGTSAQEVIGDFSSNTLYNVQINKTLEDVTISNDVSITNTLSLTDGNFVTNTSDELKLGLTATTTGGSTNSYVDGPLYKTSDNSTNDNFMFPVGKSGSYAPAGMLNDDTGGDWYIEYIHDYVPNTADNDINDGVAAPAGPVNDYGYWTISGPNSATANVVLSFEGFDVSDTPADWNDLRVMMYDAVTDMQWEMQGDADGSDDAEKTVTGPNASSFSVQIFTLASTSEDNALPVELVFFNLTAEDNVVTVAWQTVSEINNDYFEVQRSRDGVNFEILATINGAGNSDELIDYQYKDKRPYFGTAYYRLRQIDFDGESETFQAKLVNNEFFMANLVAILAPNPTTADAINFEVRSGDENSPLLIRMIDVVGKEFFRQTYDMSSLVSQGRVQPKESLKAGLYFLVLEQGRNSKTLKLIIK